MSGEEKAVGPDMDPTGSNDFDYGSPARIPALLIAVKFHHLRGALCDVLTSEDKPAGAEEDSWGPLSDRDGCTACFKERFQVRPFVVLLLPK